MKAMDKTLELFAERVERLFGTSRAFVLACLVFAGWVAFAGVHELDRKPGTFVIDLITLFVFVNMFVAQRNTNKDIKAIHLKLDELLATMDGASNQLIKAEEAPESVIDELHNAYKHLAEDLEHPTRSISVDREEISKIREKK